LWTETKTTAESRSKEVKGTGRANMQWWWGSTEVKDN